MLWELMCAGLQAFLTMVKGFKVCVVSTDSSTEEGVCHVACIAVDCNQDIDGKDQA